MNGKKARMLRKALAHERKVAGGTTRMKPVARRYNMLNEEQRIDLRKEIARVIEPIIDAYLDENGKVKARVAE